MGQRPKPGKIALSAGSGMVVGAAIGLLYGLLLVESGALFPLMGAVFGAIIGTIWEL